MIPKMYSGLAWLWPVLSAPDEYIQEAEFFQEVIFAYLAERKTTAKVNVLHLGCGGGHIDWTLKKEFHITGLDLSAPMLALARQLNPECEYLIGDMRSARLERKFEAVIAADSIDYMLTEADLKAAFQTAWDHLLIGGVFCTYAEDTREHFVNNKSFCFTEEKNGIDLAFFQNYYDPDPTDTTLEKTFVYLIRRAGQLTIEHDQHICGLFPQATWTRLLEEVGFEVEELELYDHPFLVGVKR